MKSKTLVSIVIILLAVMICLGPAACTSGAAQVRDTPALPNELPDIIPAPDEDEANYRESISAISQELNNTFYSLDGLLTDPAFESDDWVSEVSLAMSDILTLCEETGRLVPPESMTGDHILYMEAVMHFSDAIDTLLEGIRGANIDLINEASAEMWLASEIMTEE